MNITLTAEQFYFIVAFMPDKGQIERFRLINQIASLIDPLQGDEQLLEVQVSPELIAQVYFIMGSAPHRIAGKMNDQLKAVLLPQIQGNIEAVTLLQQVTEQNAKELAQILAAGKQFINDIKA